MLKYLFLYHIVCYKKELHRRSLEVTYLAYLSLYALNKKKWKLDIYELKHLDILNITRSITFCDQHFELENIKIEQRMNIRY